jgi:hypothetical protein
VLPPKGKCSIIDLHSASRWIVDAVITSALQKRVMAAILFGFFCFNQLFNIFYQYFLHVLLVVDRINLKIFMKFIIKPDGKSFNNLHLLS